jgi:coproporphyrinogen III oxidase
VHANWRYFELYNEEGNVSDRWFGGGSDLTPYYLFEEDARHFHDSLRGAMLPFGQDLYPRYKKECDEYFVNRHRDQERRGIGGVFYDHLRPADEADAERWLAFQQAVGEAFLASYLPIAERRKDLPYGEREKAWQEIRRGRYVEFNLIHDRGTLPPRARWVYDYHPEAGSPEAKMQEVCLHPRDWI